MHSYLQFVHILADLLDDTDTVPPGYPTLVILEKVALVDRRGEDANLNLEGGRKIGFGIEETISISRPDSRLMLHREMAR